MSNASKPMKQESFFISESAATNRKKVVRQDRLPLDAGKAFLKFAGPQAEIVNISSFGSAAFLSAKDSSHLNDLYRIDEVLVAKFFYEGQEIQTLHLRKVREELRKSSTSGEVLWGFESIGEPFKIERIQIMGRTNELIQKQNDYSLKVLRLPAAFREVIFQMTDWLHLLKESVDALEKDAPVDSAFEAQEYRNTIVESVGTYIGGIIPQVYKQVPPLLEGLSPEDRQLAIEFIRAKMGPYIYGAPFAARAYYKPRGYAGDYEMMNHLYRGEIAGRTLYDQCMHKYFVEEPAGLAVRNRGYYLLEKLKELFAQHPMQEPLKIISVASGPAVEQQMFLQESRSHYGRPVSFTCLDQDEESLKYAQRQIGSIERFVKSGYDFQFRNLAIRNVIARGLPEKDYDLVYSAGLFDYFTEPVAQMAAQKMMTSLKPGGRLIIGNFSKNNPSADFMELWLDWNLIYRSPEDLERIFGGLGGKLTIEKEPLGVNLFVVIEK